MELITYKTGACIRFVERTNEANYVHFRKIGGCYSYVRF